MAKSFKKCDKCGKNGASILMKYGDKYVWKNCYCCGRSYLIAPKKKEVKQ